MFSIEYFGRLRSRDGFAYQARLLQDGGPGAAGEGTPPKEVVLTDSPAAVVWGRKGSDVWVPVLASHAEVKSWRLPTRDGTSPSGSDGDLSSMVGARVGEWRLEIVRGPDHPTISAGGGERYWLGQVLSDVYEDSTMGDPHTVDVQAVDGLSSLKEKPYYDTVTTPGERLPYQGKASFLEILLRAVAPLGYDLPVRSAVAWRPVADGEVPSPGTSAGTAADPLASVYVDQAAFYSPDGEAMSCYDVVEELGRRLGARVCQASEPGDTAAWWVVSRELMTGAGFTASRYTAAGVADGTTTAGLGVAVGASGGVPSPADGTSATGPTRHAGRRSFRPAYGAVSLVHDHGVIPPLVTEGIEDGGLRAQRLGFGRTYLTVKLPIYLTEWTYAGDAMATETPPRQVTRAGREGEYQVTERNFVHAVNSFGHGKTNDPAQAKADVVAKDNHAEATGSTVAAGQVLSFSGSVNVRYGEGSEGVFNTYWAVGIAGTDWYLRRDGSWAESSVENDRAQYLVAPAAKYDERGVPMQTDVPFQFVSEPAPAAGPVTVRLYGSSDYDSGIFSEIEPGYVWWDDVSVIVATEAGEALGATETEAWATEPDGSPRPDPARAPVTVRTGQGPATADGGGQVLPTTLYWSTSGPDGAALTGDWTNSYGLVGPLDAVATGTMLRSQSAPLATVAETYRGADPSAPSVGAGSGSGDVPSPGSPLSCLLRADGAGTGPGPPAARPYPPQYLRRDLYHDRTEGEWVELAYDAALAVSAESGGTDPGWAAGGPGSTYTPVAGATGGATSAGGGLRPDPYATLAAEIAAGPTAAVEVTVPRASRDEVAALRAGDQVRIYDAQNGAWIDARLTADEPAPAGTPATVTLSVADPDDAGAPLALPSALGVGAAVVLSHRAVVQRLAGGSPVTDRGDLVAGDALGAPGRFPVGQDGQVLSADSSQPFGLRWIEPPAGGGGPGGTDAVFFMTGAGYSPLENEGGTELVDLP